MRHDIGDRIISYLDADGRRQEIRYRDLRVNLGESGTQTLEECLHEEREKVRELASDADRFARRIESLTPIYERDDRMTREWHLRCRNATEHIHDQDLSYEDRIRMLNRYFCPERNHARTLDLLVDYILAGTEGDHTAHVKSLLRFALDYVMCVMRHVKRRTGRPCAMHSIAAARGVAKNGGAAVTIIGTLMHDVLEERVDLWTAHMVRDEVRTNPKWAEYRDAGKVPKEIRQQILLDRLDDYNKRTAGFFFTIGLALFDHIRKFPQPQRHFQMLNSIMEVIEKLSRTRDLSYYQYIQQFLYPRRGQPDTIRRSDLVPLLAEEFVDAEELLDSYLENVDGFYQTPFGEFFSQEELRRNAVREILGKVLDRLNNTRDMDRDLGFTIPQRLYGAGFKNIYFVQVLEDRLTKPGIPGHERRLIEAKFVAKPKIAALFQTIDDLDFLEQEHFGRHYIDMLERELDRYKLTPEFRRLTPPERGGLFDGTIYFFNEVILGNKSFLDELETKLDKQAEYLLVFRCILESFLLYPRLIEEDMQKQGYNLPSESRISRYRIAGMGPHLCHTTTGERERPMIIDSFRRKVV